MPRPGSHYYLHREPPLRTAHAHAIALSALLLFWVGPSSVRATSTNSWRAAAGDDASASALLYEYDFQILDPHSIHGSPYGGFSRATKHRLAALPLHLPPIVSSSSSLSTSSVSDDGTEENGEEEDAIYMHVRDASGILFACRVYDEDELDPSSWNDGMFEAPRFRKPTTEQDSSVATTSSTATPTTVSDGDGGLPELIRAAVHSAVGAPTGSVQTQRRTTTATAGAATANGGVQATDPMLAFAPASVQKAAADAAAASNAPAIAPATTPPEEKDQARVAAQLAGLQGVCGQIHLGYWSYEWCFEQSITQYHIEYDMETNAVQVDQVTDLGRYKSRQYYNADALHDMPLNEWADDTPELARVLDLYDSGDVCDATGRSRQAHVHLQCCSPKVLARHKGLLYRDGHPLLTEPNLAALVNVHEQDDQVCVYNVTVCTPLLCGEVVPPESDPNAMSDSTTKVSRQLLAEDDDNDNNMDGDGDITVDAVSDAVSNEILNVLNKLTDMSMAYEGESFRDILDRTLSKLCLQSATGGWWVYEYCHKERIRQFHEVTVMRKSGLSKAVPTRLVETEHTLGRYHAAVGEADTIADDAEEEWKLVVNATIESKFYGDGNGAYYEMEYTGGDVCDHADVTESAVVAGGTGAEGGLERASTVRFYCGKEFGIAVNEDHTCHYIVDVKVPLLCEHALFRAPVSKKQIVKCLRVEDD